MKGARTSWLIAAVAVLLGGCASNGQPGGTKPASLKTVGPVERENADLNIGAWISPQHIHAVRRDIRDDIEINDHIQLTGSGGTGGGFIQTQRMMGAFFDRAVAESLSDARRFEARLAAMLRSQGGHVSYQRPQAVANPRSFKTVGYKSVATLWNHTRCLIAIVGYRFGAGTASVDSPDTVLRLQFCQPSGDFAELDTMLSSVSVAGPADVAAIRTRVLAATGPSVGPAPEVRPIAVEWEAFKHPITGDLELQPVGRDGAIRLTLPDSQGECSGTYRVGANGAGTWQISCDNGMIARGALHHGAGIESNGWGTDLNGQKIRFRLGAT